ncbi:integrator complex subunit 13-like [Rhopilema esculentum]|uniref:integrator complex subunit 13-like n=1 Tax=Rhopilema esculentum TaxID=499914 RepID=UPI0031D62D0F
MKENRLAPYPNAGGTGEELPVEKALSRLERGTRHWPMAISETLVFNMSSQLEPLLSNLVKGKLTDEDVQDCKKVIYKLQAMESRNDTLPLPMISMRGKGSKREEQYRQLWAELDLFIQEAARTSPNHTKVHDCLRGLQDSDSNFTSSNGAQSSNKDLKSSDSTGVQDLSWRELDKYSQMTEHEKRTMNQVPSDPRRRRKNSEPPEEVAAKKRKPNNQTGLKSGGLTISSSLGSKGNLMTILTNQLKFLASRRHEEFEGRKNSVDAKAELYPELTKEINISSLNTASVKEWV